MSTWQLFKKNSDRYGYQFAGLLAQYRMALDHRRTLLVYKEWQAVFLRMLPSDSYYAIPYDYRLFDANKKLAELKSAIGIEINETA